MAQDSSRIAVSRKTIAFVVSTLARTGPTRQLLNIVAHVDLTRFRPVVVTLSPEPDDTLVEEFRAANVELHSLRLSRIGGLLHGKKKLAGLLKAISPQVIHTQGIRADAMVARMQRGPAHLATVRNFPQYDYPMSYGMVRGRVMCAVHTRSLRRAEAVAAVSNAAADNLRDVFSLVSVRAVPNGVDTDRFFPRSLTEKAAIRRQLELPADAEIWVSTGHLTDRKNPLLLINVWKSMQMQRQNGILILIGDGDLYSSCVASASGLTSVRLPRRLQNVSDYLGAADFYISSSRAEGMPNAVLEAMASGLPAVLSNILPHREIAAVAGEAVQLFHMDDEADAFRTVEYMRKCGHYGGMATRARTSVEEHFSARVMSEQYQSLYHQLSSSPGRSSAPAISCSSR